MVFAWWEAHFPPRVLVHFSGNEYGKQTKLELLRLAGLQKLEASWDELELRVSGAKRPQFISPHVTQPSLESRFHPRSPSGEASLGRLTHFSLTHHSGGIGERKMGKCLHESNESSPMLLLLPIHHCCLYFIGASALKLEPPWCEHQYTRPQMGRSKSNVPLASLPWHPRQPHRPPSTLGLRLHILESSKPLCPPEVFHRSFSQCLPFNDGFFP